MRWSLSKLETYEQCPAKFNYKYNLKLEEKQNEYAERGSRVHAELEGSIKGTNELTGKLEFYHGFLQQLKRGSVPIVTEQELRLGPDWTPVSGAEGTTWVIAYLDLIRVDGETAHIWDWKTGKIYPKHESQKDLYSLMTFCTYPEVQSITFTHVYVDQGKNKQKEYTRAGHMPTKSDWAVRVAKMEGETQFIPNPSYLCRFCHFSSKFNNGPCRF